MMLNPKLVSTAYALNRSARALSMEAPILRRSVFLAGQEPLYERMGPKLCRLSEELAITAINGDAILHRKKSEKISETSSQMMKWKDGRKSAVQDAYSKVADSFGLDVAAARMRLAVNFPIAPIGTLKAIIADIKFAKDVKALLLGVNKAFGLPSDDIMRENLPSGKGRA